MLPAYRPDWQQLIEYVEKLQAEVEPDEIVVELDCEEPVDRLPESVDVFHSPERRGKGAAVSHGFDTLDTDILAFTDADGSVPPSSIKKLLEEDADLVIGSRRHSESEIEGSQTKVRKALGELFSWFSSRLLPVDVRDYQCGAKAITSDAWKDIAPGLESDGFSWDLELITEAHRKGYSITEVPVRWEDRPGSTVPVLHTSLAMLRELAKSRRKL